MDFRESNETLVVISLIDMSNRHCAVNELAPGAVVAAAFLVVAFTFLALVIGSVVSSFELVLSVGELTFSPIAAALMLHPRLAHLGFVFLLVGLYLNASGNSRVEPETV